MAFPLAKKHLSFCCFLLLSTSVQSSWHDDSWYGTTTHGPAFRSVTSFGADPTGSTDSTAAIQRAIDFERGDTKAKASAIVYFPPGRYAVSDTLVMWAATVLRGSSLAPSTLVLAAAAPGFGSAGALKPLIATSGGYDEAANASDWQRNTLPSNCNFYSSVHNLALDLSAPGNAGGVGLYWCVAQQTSVRNMTITLGAAHSGIDVCVSTGYPRAAGGGNGGGGTIEDVRVFGGEVAIRADSSQWALRGLRFEGQRVAAIHLQDMIWAFTFVDVVASSMPAFLTTGDGMDSTASMVSVIDAHLHDISGPAAFVFSGGGNPLFLQNVSLTGTTPRTFVANSSDVWLDTSRLVIDRWAGWPGGGSGSSGLVNGLFVNGAPLPALHSFLPGAPLAPLVSRPRPWLDDAPVPCNARTDCGAVGDNTTDDTAALQACIERCARVFLPSGIYLLTDTLTLGHNTALVGEGLSNLYLQASAEGFGDSTAGKAFVQTPDDASAAVLLTDVSLIVGDGNPGAVLLSWRAGERSGAWDVNVNISHNVKYGVHASGAGAGVLSNMWVWGADHSWFTMEQLTEDHAEVGFLGESRGPLITYGLACEHHRLAMIALRGASNYTLVTFQSEEATPLIGANATVHIELSAGTHDTTIYGALSCNWWKPTVTRLATALDVGPGVSIFGLRSRGGSGGPIDQPHSPLINVSTVGGWYGLLADTNVPQP